MTDLPMPQITQGIPQIPQGMGITIADWQVVLGIPAWIFIDAILLFCFAAVLVWWWAKLRKLSAINGWIESQKYMGPDDIQIWLLTRTMKLIIGLLKIEDNIMSYRDSIKIGMWHLTTRESMIRVGGSPAAVVSEDYDQSRDFISEIALTDNCDEFNANQEALKKENKEKGDSSVVIEPIEDYLDYESHGRRSLQLVHPNGLPMKSFNIFSNIRFLKYFPKGCSHMFFGGELDLEARGLHQNENPPGFFAKYGLLMIVAIVALAMICASWFVPLK